MRHNPAIEVVLARARRLMRPAAAGRGQRGGGRRSATFAAPAAAALVAMGLAACGSPSGANAGGGSSSNSPIVICEVLANSGPFAELGVDDELGAAAWAHMVNTSGGLLGHQVKLVKEDDQSDPATASTLIRKCVTQDNANFIFGPEETSTATAAIPVINSLKVVTIGLWSGWTGIGGLNLPSSQLHGYAFPGFGNIFTDNDLAMIKFVIAPKHYTRVGVIEDNAPGGLGTDTYTESLGKQYGYQVVATQKVTPGSTNDTPQVLKVLNAKPQAIVVGTIPGADMTTAIKAIRAQNPTIPIGLCGGCTIPSFIQATGGPSGLNNVYLLGTATELAQGLPPTTANKPAITDTDAYIAAMKAAGTGSAEDLNNGQNGWDVGRELQAAIKSAGSTSTDAVRTALQHQSIVVGGNEAFYFKRTPQDYGNITRIVSCVAVVKPNGSLSLFGAG